MSTILLVEDTALVREPIEAVLQREGYAVLCARDGAEAISILSRQVPDLILLDLVMPRVDGLAVLLHIHASPRLRGIPVVILSAQTDRERIRQAAKLGISGYLLKTHFSLRQLLDKVRDVLGGQTHDDLGSSPAQASSAAPRTDANSTTAPAPARSAPGTPQAIKGGSTPGSGRITAPGVLPPQAAPAGAPGDAAEAVRNLKPVLSRNEVLERVERSGELRALSPTVTQVLKLTGNARCSTEAVAKAISQDHAIALKIMKLANSTVYTRGEPVDSVNKAVVRIGIERIRQAVLNISVVERFSSAAFDDHLSTEQFWEHSIACGLIASELAHALDPAHAETAFTLGLVHDAGRIIYAEQLGEAYLKVLATARDQQLPLDQVETRMLLVNHADIMERILRLWNFSQDLIAPIVCHHLSPGNIRSTAPRQAPEALRLALANRLAHAMLLGSSGNETIYPTHDFCEALNLDASVIANIESVAREQTDDVKFAMLANSTGPSGNAWVRRQDQIRELIGAPLNPLFIGPAPEIDAFRIFCDQIRSPEQHQPNIAIVHIPAPRDRTPVSNKLRLEEQSHNVEKLPTIILSPAAKLTLEDTMLAGRNTIELATPFAIPRFIQAARQLLADQPLRAAA